VTEGAEALSAVQRITQFLNRERRKEQVPTSKSMRTEIPEANAESEELVDDNTPLRLANASFLLGGSPAAPLSSSKEVGDRETSFLLGVPPAAPLSYSEEVGDRESRAVFQVSDITLSVQRGEVLAVCGPVGCGKKCKGFCSSGVAMIKTTNTVNSETEPR
jgi:ABC-type glutathione transport system ATPase component